MKTRVTWVLLVGLLLAMAPMVGAADWDGGADSPLRFGVGARELSLGTAPIARCDASTAPFWNPARLADVEYLSFSAFHTTLFESGVAYQYAGLAIPTLDFGSIGFGVQRLAVENIEVRDADNIPGGTFSDTRLGVHMGYGRYFGDYQAGVTVSFEHHSMHDYSATSSPGVNIAVMRSFDRIGSWLQSADIVLTGSNVLRQNLELAQEAVSEPTAFSGALGVTVKPDTWGRHSLRLSMSVKKIDQLDIRTATGLEYTYGDMLSLRGGLRDGEWSAGAGVAYRWLGFDYAVVNRPLGLLHMFAVTSSFGSSMSERREARELAREAAFQDQMLSTLEERNSQTVAQLSDSGQQVLAAGLPREAATLFDRALFVARSAGQDTTTLAALLAESREAHELKERATAHATNLDSARASLGRGDLLGARYYAALALDAMPQSTVADALLRDIDYRIDEDRSGERRLAQQMRQIDSLLAYGAFDQAVLRARSIAEIAPDDDAAAQLLRRAMFASAQDDGTRAFAAGDFDATLRAVERAEELYPSHPWCEVTLSRVTKAREVDTAASGPLAATESRRVSEAARKEAEERYRMGQEAFEEGEFEAAIANWERVEVIAGDFMSVREYLVRAYKYLGVEHYSNNDLARALTVWRRAAELMPRNEEIRSYIQRAESEMARIRELSYEP